MAVVVGEYPHTGAVEWLLGVAIAVLATWIVLLVIFWLFRPKGVPLAELVGIVPDLVRMLRSIVADTSLPTRARLVVVGLLISILAPIDLIPDFIPVLGQIDDVVVAVVALRYLWRRLGRDALRERWPGSDQGFDLLQKAIGA